MSACLKSLEFMRMRYEQYRTNFEEYKLRCPLSLYSTLKLPRSMIFLVALQPNSNTKYEQNTKVDFILVEIDCVIKATSRQLLFSETKLRKSRGNSRDECPKSRYTPRTTKLP